MNTTPLSRRAFLRTTATGIAAPSFIPAAARGQAGRPAPGERVTLGVIGVGAMGTGNLKSFLAQPDAQVVAVCDVQDFHYRDEPWGKSKRVFGTVPAKQLVEDHYGKEKRAGFKGCAMFSDFRNLCARKDIDAVVVATPDHWHALAALEALRRGKDVYCEKPVTHLFAEGQLLYREVARRKAIFQTGSQQRSEALFRQAVELVRNGAIGQVRQVEVGLPAGHEEPIGDAAMQDPPANLDYESWVGPAPLLPYIPARHHRNWRWHLAYGGGQLMDWIGHHNDIAHWALDLDRRGPETVEAVGWTWPKTHVYNAPVEYEVRCAYPGGVELSIASRHAMGTKWIGADGWVHVTRGRLTASNPAWTAKDFNPGPVKVYESPGHHRNFLDGIKTRQECVTPAETAHRSITPGHLGYIAAQVGRKLKWDARNEKILGDASAEKLLEVKYRYPWAFA